MNISNQTKSQQIADQIEDWILSEKYMAGDQLPSQHQLAQKFNTSSRSVREAFKNLETKGLIEISQGKRAMVKSNKLDSFINSLSSSILNQREPDKKIICDLLQVRTNLEVSAARELSRDPNRMIVVRSLSQCISKMSKLQPELEKKNPEAIDKFKRFNFEFHTTLFRSNNNIIMNSIYENLAPMLYRVIEKTPDTFKEQERTIKEYSYLVEALEEGQTDLAVALTLVTQTNIRKKIEKMDW